MAKRRRTKYPNGGFLKTLSGIGGLINPALGVGLGLVSDLVQQGQEGSKGDGIKPLQNRTFQGNIEQFSNGGKMKRFNFPSHEQGGGNVDSNGTISASRAIGELEKNETLFKGFVFSDVLGNGEQTFADMSKDIADKFDKPDVINQNTLEVSLSDLSRKNEALKKRLGGIINDMFRGGGDLPDFGDGIQGLPSLEHSSTIDPRTGTTSFNTTAPRSLFESDDPGIMGSGTDQFPTSVGGGNIKLPFGGLLKYPDGGSLDGRLEEIQKLRGNPDGIRPLNPLEVTSELLMDGNTSFFTSGQGLFEGQTSNNPAIPQSFQQRAETGLTEGTLTGMQNVLPQGSISNPLNSTAPTTDAFNTGTSTSGKSSSIGPLAESDFLSSLSGKDPSKLKDLEIANLFFRGFVQPTEQVERFDNPFEAEALNRLENSPVTFTNQINEVRRQQGAANQNLNSSARSVNVQRAGFNQIAANSAAGISDVLQRQQQFNLQRNSSLSQALDNFGRQRVQASRLQDTQQAQADANKETFQNDFVKSISNRNVFGNNQEVARLQANEGLQLLNQLVPNFKTHNNYGDYLRAVSIDDKEAARKSLKSSGLDNVSINRIINATFFKK